MSKKIDTFEKLLAEKQKLEILFAAQKELVRYELDDLKKDLDPAIYTLQFLKNLTIRNKDNPVLQTGIDFMVDLLAEKLSGSHAGFLRKTVIPFIIKNYTSNFVDDAFDMFIEKLGSFFNPQEADEEESSAQ